MAKNTVPLTRELLLQVLPDLAKRLLRAFNTTITLTVHGGAVMVLHPDLKGARHYTQDVDFIHRMFAAEWQARGVYDATQRLQACIAQTAARFGLGPDWMNADPDMALPVQRDAYGNAYETVGSHSSAPGVASSMTIFQAHGLHLIAVPWMWAIALKLVRYQKNDPMDVAAIIRMAMRRLPHLEQSWRTPQYLEANLVAHCSPMYQNYHPQIMDVMRQRMADACRRAATPQLYW